MLSVLIVVVLVMTSLSALFVTGGHETGDDPSATEAPDTTTSTDHGKGFRKVMSGSYEWDAYVDLLGNVRVILSTESTESLDLIMGRAVKKIDPGCDWSSDSKTSSLLALKGQAKNSMEAVVIETKPDTLRQLLAGEPSLWAYPDLTVNATEVTANIIQTGADQIWSTEDVSGNPVTGLGVTVAVIDTGIDYTHPDLGGGFGAGYKVVGGYDFVNDDDDPLDDNGHGTHVAGIIAADGEIKGVAPGATLYAYKALGADGSGFMSDVVLAIDAAIDPNGDGQPDDHVDVISMSLGGDGESNDPICQAVQRAVVNDVLVVVAAGNSGPTMGTVSSPGISPYSLTVGALDSEHMLANFSSRGPTEDLLMKPDISAPGVSILSTVPYSGATSSSPTGYKQMSGTSMATPHVSGAAALLIQSHSEWTVAQIKSALITGATQINESLWEAGSGELWIPSSDNTLLFVTDPLISYGRADSSTFEVTLTNADGVSSFAITSRDWFALSADGEVQTKEWANYSSILPSSLNLVYLGTGQLSLSVSAGSQSSEGYYDGYIWVDSAGPDIRIPFGFMILGELRVHVFDLLNREVFDPYGGVWVYSIPDATVAIGKRGGGDPAPPASFLLPSGTYSVHSAGHQLLYTYSDPYFLSTTITLERMQTLDVNLSMLDAREITLDLENEEGNAIYVKDFRMHARYEGERNLSFDLTGSDYSIFGSEMFALSPSKTLRLGDTQATVGIQLSGFSYSDPMWDFMYLNQDNWFEFKNGVSTAFLIEASADLQYLLSWEFPLVDATVPSVLSYDLASSGVYTTKYDIPGTIVSPWCNWDTHRAMGGDASFYVRRDTDTSLNPFFSGMTRTTIVSGVFSELYFPRSIFGGYIERAFYISDYTQMLHAATISEIYLPNRYFLDPLAPTDTVQTIGAGPFYPSVHTENNATSMVLFHPLLRDQNGWKVGGISTPMLSLYRGGGLVGIYQLSEYLARPDAKRIIDLTASGTYTAKISYSPMTQLYDEVLIELGFTVPGTDIDPPVITGMELEQRFVPGQSVPVAISVDDASASISVEMQWRAGASASWSPLAVTDEGDGDFSTSISTAPTDTQIDIQFTATDSIGNFISYTAYNASLPQVPVVFNLNTSVTVVGYKLSGVAILLKGKLTDSLGNPLSSVAAVPIELTVDGKKVGMILDEYVSGGTHTHNGTIRFDWVVRPTEIFTRANETKTITASFDLGLYEPITCAINLTSIWDENLPPSITLLDPMDESVVAAGVMIDLEIVDDGLVSAEYILNSGNSIPFADPWDISTANWDDGNNALEVKATDDDLMTANATYSFDIDALYPEISIIDLPNGSSVPRNHSVLLSVYDARLSEVTYSKDGGPAVPLAAPYTISMVGWEIGPHTVSVTAVDVVGHTSEAYTNFTIEDTTIVVRLDAPADGAVVKAGTVIELSVIGDGAITCTWDDGSGANALTSPYDILTDGWAEGTHSIRVYASNDLGDSFTLPFTIVIDDTAPSISLVLPANEGAFVTKASTVLVRIEDPHYQASSYTVWGVTKNSTEVILYIILSRLNVDGTFVINVTATDQAGNVAWKDFTLFMDSNPPIVNIQGIYQGAPVAPLDEVTITVEDAYLSEVLLTVDDVEQVIGANYSLILNMTLGYHTLRVLARDYAGYTTETEKISFYIDGTEPEVSITSGDEFVKDTIFQVAADLTDDFKVAEVTLYYSLPDGGFQHTTMSHNGSFFVAILPAGVLWDGMELYVVAVDAVGNAGTSDHQVLHSTDADDNSTLITGFNTILLIGAVAAAAAIIILFMIFRKKEDEGQWEIDLSQPSGPEHKKETTDLPRMSAPETKIEPPAYVMAAEVPREPPAAPAPMPRPEPPKVAAVKPLEAPRMRTVKLIEAIPDPVLTQDDQNQKFYNDLLADLEKVERELNENAQKGSVFMDDGEFEKLFDLDDKSDDTGKPRQVPGLKWKKLME